MSLDCWIDGDPADSVPVLDRGLHYGDGLFETLPIRDGRIPLLDAHLERLAEGCRRLGMTPPAAALLRGELHEAAKHQSQAVLKLMLTRGSGGRGYRPPEPAMPVRILLRYPWPDHPDAWQREGISLCVCDTRLGRNPTLAGLKHLSRLEQVLARAEWGESDSVQEGLMLDEEGLVVEGTMTNVFAVTEEGRLLTPELGSCGVAGVMRRHLIESALTEGVRVEQRRVSLAEFLDHRELFVCNSIVGVWPVRRVVERDYVPGSMTRRAQRWAAQA
jgi:4-amino-4-deoxychorismate lyase